MNLPLPRLAEFTIERERISAWLNRCARVPLRCILAPTGSGKTSALVCYARSNPNTVHYLHQKHDDQQSSLEAQLRDILGLKVATYAQLMSELGACETTELIFDGIERLSTAEQAFLERLVYDMPANVGLIYAGTSTKIAVHRLEAAGLAKVLARDELAFSLLEMRLLSEGLRLSATDPQLTAIQERCDGWAVVAADILRECAENETSLVDGYERWLLKRGRSFTAYIQEEIERFSSEGRIRFEKVLCGETINDEDLTILEDVGALIVAADGAVRPYRVVSDLMARPLSPVLTKNTRVTIRMFGRFSIRSGDREVSWIRRRDQQIFRYIAVRTNGRVKKSEIVEVFWPDADPHLAAQSLRTACSNIRKALATIMDITAVEQIFLTEGQELCVNLEHAVVDVRRFKAHINEGNEADNEGRVGDAVAHYRAAEMLYRADLFGGEPEEAWFLPQREIYRNLVSLARERVSSLRIDIGETDSIVDDFDNDLSVNAT